MSRVLGMIVGMAVFLGLVVGSVRAQEPPPADATPGTQGISVAVLSGLDPSNAGGQGLEMREFTWEPGAYVTPHTHPAAFIICTQSGALGFSIQSGAAVVTRSTGIGTPTAAEPMASGDEVVLAPRDCVAVDQSEAGTIHTAWNASDQQTITIETYLFDRDLPGRTFVDAQGTPIP
jgi:hypothetical protein